MELSAEDTRSKLKVYKGVIVRPPPAVVDCGDYPGLNRERFNCLVNGEKLPPAPDVGTDETLLHNSLNLVQPKENYTLVFREEFDGGSENDPCGNLRLLRKEVWSYSDEICAMTDVNGKICEGVEDGSYVMSISQSCRPRGLKTHGKLGFTYGYIEIKYSMRMFRYPKFTNQNIVLGSSVQGSNHWLIKYNVEMEDVEDYFTNVAPEVDMFECRASKKRCIAHQYVNRPTYPYFSGLPSMRTVKETGVCSALFDTTFAIRFTGPACPTEGEDDFVATITTGLEWTPRGYRTFTKVKELTSPLGTSDWADFTLTPQREIGISVYAGNALRYDHIEYLERDEQYGRPVLNSILEQLGILHLPGEISIGTWQQGFTNEQNLNEVKMAIDYIRVFQPEDRYVEMEPVYK